MVKNIKLFLSHNLQFSVHGFALNKVIFENQYRVLVFLKNYPMVLDTIFYK